MKNEDDEINQLFIEATNIKPAHARKIKTPKNNGKKTIKVRSSVEVARDTYKRNKKLHQAQIKALRSQIKSHKLLIKQAKTAYRIFKLSTK